MNYSTALLDAAEMDEADRLTVVAAEFGPGLIAADLPDLVLAALRRLWRV